MADLANADLLRRSEELEAENTAPRADEPSEPTEADPAGPAPPDSRKRGLALRLPATGLIALGTVLIPIALAASWSKTALADTERFVAAYTPLADDPRTQAYVIDETLLPVNEQIVTPKITSADSLRAKYRNMDNPALMVKLAQSRPSGDPIDPETGTATALKQSAVRCLQLDEEITAIDDERDQIITARPPMLRHLQGAGTDVASQLLITVDDNPERVANQARFAALTGVASIPTSSHKIGHQCPTRGRDGDADRAIHQVVLIRMSSRTVNHKGSRMSADRYLQRAKQMRRARWAQLTGIIFSSTAPSRSSTLHPEFGHQFVPPEASSALAVIVCSRRPSNRPDGHLCVGGGQRRGAFDSLDSPGSPDRLFRRKRGISGIKGESIVEGDRDRGITPLKKKMAEKAR